MPPFHWRENSSLRKLFSCLRISSLRMFLLFLFELSYGKITNTFSSAKFIFSKHEHDGEVVGEAAIGAGAYVGSFGFDSQVGLVFFEEEGRGEGFLVADAR